MSLGDSYVVRPDGVIVPCVTGTQGVWLVDLVALLGPYEVEAQMPTNLAPELESECEQVCALLHRRSGHTSHGILREAVRNQLVTGVRLDRKFFSTKARQKFKALCDICAKAKISRVSLPRSLEQDQVAELRPGKRVGADVLIMLNVPSREEYTSVLFLVDFACKYCWVYLLLKKRDEGSAKACLQKFLDEDFKQFGVTLEHFPSDGGAELVSAKILSLRHSRGITTSHSPRDTPEMNSTVERRVRDVKERTLSMLLHSTLPVPFWWLALRAAVYIHNWMPTRTTEGYMTPFECLRKALLIFGSYVYGGVGHMCSNLRRIGPRISMQKRTQEFLWAMENRRWAMKCSYQIRTR